MENMYSLNPKEKVDPFNDLILMCKNTEVYDIEHELVLDAGLLPGIMATLPVKQRFVDWMEKRYAEKSNTFARQLRGHVFGQGNRRKINVETHALSLSDSYWLKTREENITFEEISPYYSSFWKGDGYYKGEAVPTLYVNGYLPKYWATRELLIKDREKHEIYCYQLAVALGLRAAEVEDYEDKIAVHNFTNPNCMFESAEASGKIDPENFTTEDLFRVFGEFGFDMIFFDALIGNGDRHAGNFGFLRDTSIGRYIEPAPLFDFDHAFESKNPNDVLIQEVNKYKHLFIERHEELVERADTVILTPYIRERLKAIR
jgi:hypothetical protein